MNEELEPLDDEEEVVEPVEQDDEELASVREEAKKYGWRPREEFTREPDNWVDADRFMEFDSTKVRILNDRLKETAEEFKSYRSEQDRKFDELRQVATSGVRQASELAEQRWREQFEALEQRKRAAVETADSEAFDRAATEQQKLYERVPEPVPHDQPRQFDKSKVDAALADKPWKSDPFLYRQAGQIIDAHPEAQSMDEAGQVAFADQKLREYFPHKFEAPRAPAKPARTRVEGGGLASLGGSKGVDSLPAEARAIGKEFVAEGLFKSMDEYAKDYWEQNA